MSRAMVAGSFAVAALMLMAAMSHSARPAFAAFHCMRIHAVMSGFNGNTDVQFVELRMNAGGQTVLGGHKLRFLDAAGVQKAEFTFPGGVSNGLTGDSVLIGSREFNDRFTPGGNANFEFDSVNTTGLDATTPVQGPGGKVIFEPAGFNCLGGGPPIDSVAYGSGAVTADFGSKAVALPDPTTAQGLRLGNLATTPSNNSTEYTLQTASSTTEVITTGNLTTDFRFPRTNGRTLLAVVAPAVGGEVREAPLPEAEEAPLSEDSSGTPMAPIVAVGVAAFAAAIGVGALQMRRRRRA